MSRRESAGDTKVLRFNNEVPIEVQRTKYQATAKYDRKLVRKRLEIEEWMHNELKILYRCKVCKILYRCYVYVFILFDILEVIFLRINIALVTIIINVNNDY